MLSIIKLVGILHIILTLLTSVIPVKLRNLKQEFHHFKITYNKTYSSAEEEQIRLDIFKRNLEKIEAHNERYRRNETSFTLAMNQFGDFMPSEFHEKVTGFMGYKHLLQLDMGTTVDVDDAPSFLPPANVKLPDSVDWRELGAVTPVKNQGHCGSCWSFSATGSLEGQHFRKTGLLHSLSEQNLIDCSGKYGNVGCRGGLMTQAFKYIKENKGIEPEISYPYEATEANCRYAKNNSVGSDSGYIDIKNGDEQHLKAAVATVGPISSAIDAKYDTFQFYSTGVYYDTRCDNAIDILNHGVLVVGYGTDDKKRDYWIVKNSWGIKWGQKGYIYMARNRDNHCGTATACSFPLV